MSRKKPCSSCDLIALDSKGHEVPMNHPSATGVAYREPPKHGGRCSEAVPLAPLNSLLGELEAEWRKLSDR
jgi:hypothetical protein